MKFVQPIRDRESIEAMKNELLKNGYRDYLLFSLGINTGLRISDILALKVKDVKATHITIIEKKTNKSKRAKITASLKEDINKFISNMNDEEHLFQSRKGDNKAITRVQAYRILNKVASKLNIDEIGTHTLRKTFAYHFYQQYKDIALLQELFNHSAPSVTLRYIGINQDVLDEAMSNFDL
jgi:integrase